MLFGELYRHNGEWKFRAVGQGYASDSPASPATTASTSDLYQDTKRGSIRHCRIEPRFGCLHRTRELTLQDRPSEVSCPGRVLFGAELPQLVPRSADQTEHLYGAPGRVTFGSLSAGHEDA